MQKKRVLSLVLSMIICIAMMPVAVFADGGGVRNVTTAEELKEALNDTSVTEINVNGAFTYGGDINGNKKITIPEGKMLSLSNYTSTVTGTFVINGTVEITGESRWYWKASTSGSGKLIGNKDAFNNIATFVDYGCWNGGNLENCRINIIKDTTQTPVISFPDDPKTGDTLNISVSNLIDGVDLAEVFKFTWKDEEDGSSRYNNSPAPVLTEATSKLKLTLTPKSPYIMCTLSGSIGSLDGKCTVSQKLLDEVYVNGNTGSDSALGDASHPVKTIDDAQEKVKKNGTIILQSDASITSVVIDKNLTIKSEDSKKHKVTANSNAYIKLKDNVNIQFETLNLENIWIKKSNDASTISASFKNCSGSLNNYTGDIGTIKLDNSQLRGTICAEKQIELANESSLTGNIWTKDLSAKGNGNSLAPAANQPVNVTGSISAKQPITLIPSEMKKGVKLIEVPTGSDDAIVKSFKLQDGTDSKYALKCRKGSMYTYIGISEAVAADNGYISVFYEPKINNEVKSNSCGYGFGDAISVRTEWQDKAAGKTWKLGDIPKLIVKLSANDDNNPFSHFDNSFDVSKIEVYTGTAENPDQTLNDKAVCSVEDGQGVSEDGRVYTFTITYPAVSKLPQNVSITSEPQEMNCGQFAPLLKPSGYKGKLSYESNNEDVVSVDETTGWLTARKPGEATITVKVAETDTYTATQTSYTVKVSHKYSDTWEHDKTNHWKECACGDKKGVAEHTESDWIIDKAATTSEAGAKHKECTECKAILENAVIPIISIISPSIPKDNVTNNPADKSTTADLIPAVKDNKAETTVDAKTADKIIDRAVENNSTEVVIDAAGNNSVASSEVAIPEKTVKELAAKTDANLVIKTDNGKVDLDKTALDAVAAQAGNTGFVRLIIETIKSDENICHINLKLITSNGAVKDFNGGIVTVTITLTKELAAKDVVCVYINDNGIYTLVEGVLNADGTYTFTTGHFSEYAVMAKAEADKVIAEQLNTLIKEVNLKVRTSKTSKKNIKAVVSGDITALTDAGYTVKYKFYRSANKSSKYAARITKEEAEYLNTEGKKDKKYYYKAKLLIYDNEGNLVAQTELKQCKYGMRHWTK